MNLPRLVIAGLSGDSGKTLISLSLSAYLKSKGDKLSVFKKGPDYIDAAWLGFAARHVCYNLDTFLMGKKEVMTSFIIHSQDSQFSLIEGNRGLYDGVNVKGTHSTAELAKLLKAPVVLVVDVTKMTRTTAAIINGCRDFDRELNLAGIILNNVAGKRHQKIITDAITEFCSLPVLGSIPKLGKEANLIPGRHLGLVPPAEFAANDKLTSSLCSIAEKYLDVDEILNIAKSAPDILDITEKLTSKETITSGDVKVRIGYFKDSVFTFYYPDNLEALEKSGAELIPVSSVEDKKLPEIDALYIGGGFPETHAKQLSANRELMNAIKDKARLGLPIYAECGGLIYLCNSLKWNDESFPMTGLFDIDLQMNEKPVGHGYTENIIDQPNSYYNTGEILKGHEFHYSGSVVNLDNQLGCMAMNKGVGLGNKRDGLCYKNVFACYTHIHALGTKSWASTLVHNARDYNKSMKAGKTTETISDSEGERYRVTV
ncbi:MAG: cobyrinate a,c-diamide synthase [bacterium]